MSNGRGFAKIFQRKTFPQGYPNYKTVHRRFQQWCREEVLREVLTDLVDTLREEGEIDESECFIDATLNSAKGGGEEIGSTRRGKGAKIMAIADRLPFSVSTYAANHHEVTVVQLSFDFSMIEAQPENLIGDKAYDSDQLDEQLRRERVEMIAPHKSTRKRKTQDAMASPPAGALGILSTQLSWFRAACRDLHPVTPASGL